jgi:hypothetical protein
MTDPLNRDLCDLWWYDDGPRICCESLMNRAIAESIIPYCGGFFIAFFIPVWECPECKDTYTAHGYEAAELRAIKNFREEQRL